MPILWLNDAPPSGNRPPHKNHDKVFRLSVVVTAIFIILIIIGIVLSLGQSAVPTHF